MGNKKGRGKPRDADGSVVCLISGADDLQALKQGFDTVPNVEAGSRLHGLVVFRTRAAPPPSSPPPYALTKLKLKSKYLRSRIHISDEPSPHSRHRYCDSKRWFEHTDRFCLAPYPAASAPGEDGLFVRVYPFSFDVPTKLFDSVDSSDGRKSTFWSLQCTYTFRVKVRFGDVDATQVWKTAKRRVDIVQQRPSGEDIFRTPQVADERRRNWLEFGGGGGKVEVSAALEAFVFMEGEQVSIVATIENRSNSELHSGELKVVAKRGQNVHIDFTHVEYHTDKRTVVAAKLRGLAIPPATTVTRKFGLHLPQVVEPPSTELDDGKDNKLKIWHYALLEISVPGKDVKAKLPLKLAPDPAKLLHSPPLHAPTPSSAAAAAGDHQGYVPFIPPPPLPTYAPYPKSRAFLVRVLSARDLPKMDGLFGKADPYITVLVNDAYFRCTDFVPRSLDPEWNQTFWFYLTEEELVSVPQLKIACYDRDMIGTDDLIGRVAEVVHARVEDRNRPAFHTLSSEKKGKVKSRGEVQISFDWV